VPFLASRKRPQEYQRSNMESVQGIEKLQTPPPNPKNKHPLKETFGKIFTSKTYSITFNEALNL
jgi:hypothetical protein